jgi:hypothetical protein
MRKKYRRIYAFTLVIVFFVIAPILVLYATGYRYDFGDNRVIKTGVLSIDSDPRNAQITINGEETSSKTPTVVKNLFPGDYSVSISKDGYFAWEKSFSVSPNRSTSTERVSLLKSDNSTLVTEERASSIIFSQNDSYIAYIVPNKNKTVNLIVKQQSTLRTIRTIEGVDPDMEFLFSNNNGYIFSFNPVTNNIERLISLTEQYDVLVSSISSISIKKLIESSKDNYLYAITENGLYQIDTNKGTAEILISKTIVDAILIGQSLYYIEEREDVPILLKADFDNLADSQEILTLSHNGEFFLSNIVQDYLVLHDSSNKELSLIGIQNQYSLNLNKLNPDVTRFVWSPNHNLLLFYNDFEIWVLNLELDQQELLIRSSGQIRYADWSPDGKWIIYSHEGFIKAIELDERGKRNIIDLAQTDNIPFSINNDKKVMFYHDSSQNLFQKVIQ